ncbi:hypothetical protein [Kytococcus sedentarius]|uniref:Uncharacterized protein n=1 Tax=Kytococcus sedentarius (strain ATCC 14392 / DSM 20547 / JCM 11482 / CCUG 33030 / NBRC 15357 / NCTC 11040 / CCM 314 / 541) TaxID=478801 RepID=C7NF41_KYTSD|nr:hypothetical protein [Kytococcus sedentarius]ACV07294.1 hypothetical protein Ksed_23190 [Kytococcus sedentarius DSM 20547]
MDAGCACGWAHPRSLALHVMPDCSRTDGRECTPLAVRGIDVRR